VEVLNRRAQQLRIRAGELDTTGRHATGRYDVYVGDEIATRHNDRQLRTDRGEMVRNRALWTVDTINRNGSLIATGPAGIIHLPVDYVRHHVELGYARSGIAGQGRNVHAGLSYYDGPADVRNVYVPLSRGTAENHAFIVTRGEETAVDVFTRYLTSDWIDQPAHVRRAELSGQPLHRPGLLDAAELRALFDRRDNIHKTLETADSRARQIPAEINRTEQHRTELEQHAVELARRIDTAQQTIDRYDRPLHRRRHQDELTTARRDLTHLPGELERCRVDHTAAETRIGALRRAHGDAVATLRRRPDLTADVGAIDEQLAADRHVRSRIARHERTPDITKVMGRPPPCGPAAQRWDHAAGVLDQQHAATGTPINRLARELGLARPTPRIDRLVPELEPPGLSR
ncbi:MAG: hypothetical protein ICV72_10790, partial [Aldersonia sp.]|nr:hypothetical protein [Aldersonia sp.]